MEEFKKLFEPGRIGAMNIKNRIIMAPMGTRFKEQKGYCSDAEIALWEERAKGGVGLIHKTIWCFSPEFTNKYGRPYHFGDDLHISGDGHAESAKRFIRALKLYDVRLSCLVSHPGRVMYKDLPEYRPVAPSAIRDPITKTLPRELSKEEIEEFVEAFAEGIAQAEKIGFEAVMIHGGHGYLIHQFLSPRTNKRTDEYGGNVVNRTRFACEIIKRTREKVGPDFPILFRMNGNDYVEGGIKLEEALQQAILFVDAGAEALDVSAGPREAHHWQYITHLQPYGALVNLATAIKKVVRVPVCTVGKINPLMAEHILRDKSADFVDFLRSLLADPEWPNKAREGRLEDIRPCIYCVQCQTDRTYGHPSYGVKGPGRFCSVNPAMGFELEYARAMQPVISPKKVIVIGGGLAGMEAARTLAKRGHETTLYEKSDKLGGQWNIVTIYHTELADLTQYLSGELDKAKVKIHLNREVDVQMIRDIRPQAVVVATGAKPLWLNVPGSDGKNVVLAVDVLTKKINVGEEVVIIGGRGIGLDTAIFLANFGGKVSVIEMRKIAWGFHHPIKLSYLEKLLEYGIYTYPDTTVDSITENGVNIIYDGELRFIKADTVVLAVGYRSCNTLFEQLKDLVPEVHAVGDCVEPRDVMTAINEASLVGRMI